MLAVPLSGGETASRLNGSPSGSLSFASTAIATATPGNVETVSGRRHQGRLTGLAVDHVVVTGHSGSQVLVATAAIALVQPAGAGGQPADADTPPGPRDRTLAEALGRLAEDQPRVSIGVRGRADPVAGTLGAVGRDVVSLRTDAGDVLYLHLPGITEVTVVP